PITRTMAAVRSASSEGNVPGGGTNSDRSARPGHRSPTPPPLMLSPTPVDEGGWPARGVHRRASRKPAIAESRTEQPPGIPPSGEVEEEDLGGRVAGQGERALVGDGRAIAGGEDHVAEADLSARDLDPGMTARGEGVGHGLSLAEEGRVDPRVLVNGHAAVCG